MAYGFISMKCFDNTFQDLVVLQLRDPLVCLSKEKGPNNLAQTHSSAYVYLYTKSLRSLQAKTTLSPGCKLGLAHQARSVNAHAQRNASNRLIVCFDGLSRNFIITKQPQKRKTVITQFLRKEHMLCVTGKTYA